jgi:hypothetical protein
VPSKPADVSPPRAAPLTVRATISPPKTATRPTLLAPEAAVLPLATIALAWPVRTTDPFSGNAKAAST